MLSPRPYQGILHGVKRRFADSAEPGQDAEAVGATGEGKSVRIFSTALSMTS